MKVSTTQDTTFRPVTVTLVLESQAEVDTFRTLMCWNESVPKFVATLDASLDHKLAVKMMRAVVDDIVHAGLED